MAENLLVKKMKLKPGSRIGLMGAPATYLQELAPLPADVDVQTSLRGKFDWMQVFVKNKAEVDKLIPRVVPTLKPESLLWVSFPKGSSKMQTDLTRDKGWDALKGCDLKWVTLISVNDVWSAFCLRPYRDSEERQAFWS